MESYPMNIDWKLNTVKTVILPKLIQRLSVSHQNPKRLSPQSCSGSTCLPFCCCHTHLVSGGPSPSILLLIFKNILAIF